MKKNVLRRVLVVAMMAVVMSLALVGCTPNRPDKFMAAYAVSQEQGYKIGEGIATIEFKYDGENMYLNIAGIETYYIKNGESMDIYSKTALTGWKHEEITDATKIDSALEGFNTAKENALAHFVVYAENNEVDVKATDEKLEGLFIEEDGKWYTAADGVAVKDFGYFDIDGSDMKIMVGSDDSAVCMSTFSLKVDIEVPAEAKEAKK